MEGDRSGGLSRATLAEQITRQVMDAIVEEGLRPGDLLPSESALTARFGVSRPVVREALRSLAALSVIEIANGKGATVKPLSPELLSTFFHWALSLRAVGPADVYELRKGVEGQGAALAAERITPEEAADLSMVLERMRGCLGDAQRYAELDLHLHLAIAAASGNRLISHFVESFRQPTHDVIQGGLERMGTDRERYEEMQEVHERIVGAIRAHDPVTAREEMELHIGHALTEFREGTEDAPTT